MSNLFPLAPCISSRLNEVWLFEWMDKNSYGAYDEKEWIELWEEMEFFMQEHGMMAIPVSGSGVRPVTDILWKVNEDTPETPSPLVIDDKVFFIRNGEFITVIKRESGEVVHKETIGGIGTCLASPMYACNRLYTSSYNDVVTVLSADDFSILAQNRLHEKIGASSVAVDDVLYIRTDKRLYAFREQ